MLESIERYLIARGWIVKKENELFLFYYPPESFKFESEYYLLIPKTKRVDEDRYSSNLIDILSQFYEINKLDLKEIITSKRTVLSVRVYDNKEKDGKIAFTKFEDVIESIKNILLDTASFVIDKTIIFKRTPIEAKRYLNLCNFLHTEKGSFITKVELPSEDIIKDREIFEDNEVVSYVINKKVFDVLQYANETMNKGQISVDLDYIEENRDVLNLKILRDIRDFYDKTQIENVDFVFNDLDERKEVKYKNITKTKLFNLRSLIDDVDKELLGIEEMEFKGQIVSLKSKNPEGERNIIEIAGIYENIIVSINAKLDSIHYKDAIDAHKMMNFIKISGLSKKLKSDRYKMLEVFSFEVIE